MGKIGLLLDVTGTLVDNTDHFLKTYNEARENFNLSKLTEEELLSKTSSDYLEFVHRLGFGTQERLKYIKNLWDKNLNERKYKIELYPGAKNFLEKMRLEKDVEIVLTTGDHKHLVQAYAEFLQELKGYKMVSRDDVKKPKPDRQHLEAARKIAGSHRADTIVMDDMPDTLITARTLGMGVVASSWGLYKYNLWKLDLNGVFVAKGFEDAFDYILKFKKRHI